MAFAVVRNVEAMSVAVTLFINVATLMAFARTVMAKTSDGTSQAPGPIPTEKKAKYKARPQTAKAEFVALPKKLTERRTKDMAIPRRETKNSGLLPLRSKK